MTIEAPFNRTVNRMYSLVAPFTYRDSATLLEILEAIGEWVRSIPGELNEILAEFQEQIDKAIADLIAENDQKMGELVEFVNNNIDELKTYVNTEISNLEVFVNGEMVDMRAYVDAAIQSIINSTIEVSDPVINGVIIDTESESRKTLDFLYGNSVRKHSTPVPLRKVFQCPAREVPGVWVSGFAHFEDAIYVCFDRPDGFSSIDKYVDGVRVDRNIYSAPSSSENIIPFRNGNGELCFIVRTASGMFYAIHNYDLNTTSEPIAIKGAFKMGLYNNEIYTCDANALEAGVGLIWVYSFDSVKSGNPVLLRSVLLENRNMYSKAQAMSIHNGDIVFNMGRNSFDPAICRYTNTGKHIESYVFDKPEFGEILDGTFIDPDDYFHESEGSDVFDGKLYTGHIVYGSGDVSSSTFVIIEHGEGEPVATGDISNPSRWYGTAFTPSALFNVEECTYRRVNDAVTIEVTLTAKSEILPKESAIALGSVPRGFRPDNIYRQAITGGAGFTALANFYPTGGFAMTYLTNRIAEGSYIYICASYQGGNGETQ